jgi:hypothetical protein
MATNPDFNPFESPQSTEPARDPLNGLGDIRFKSSMYPPCPTCGCQICKPPFFQELYAFLMLMLRHENYYEIYVCQRCRTRFDRKTGTIISLWRSLVYAFFGLVILLTAILAFMLVSFGRG